MTFDVPMYRTGDEPRAGYCGGCGEYVGPHHVCQPLPPACACGLPRSEYEGHNCPANGWKWTRWPS